MSHDIRDQLRTLRAAKRRIDPDAAWVSRTRDVLLAEVIRTMPTEKVRFAARVKDFWTSLVSSKVASFVRKPVMAVVSAVAVIGGGSILSVSAAEQSLPGDFFYGLKLVTEQARLALTTAKEERIVLKTEFTQRRVNELKQVATDPARPENVTQVAEILKRDLDTVKQQLTDVKQTATTEKRVAVAKLVDEKTINVITELEATKATLTPEQKGKLTEIQSVAAAASVSAIEVLAEVHETDGGTVLPAEDVAQAIEDHTKAVSGVTQEPIVLSASSTSSTFVTVPDSLAATSTLPELVSQVKTLTTQAFASQMTKDGLAASASGTATGTLTDVSATTGTTSATTGTAAIPSGSASSTPPSSASGTAP